jgi:hypothetical protein
MSSSVKRSLKQYRAHGAKSFFVSRRPAVVPRVLKGECLQEVQALLDAGHPPRAIEDRLGVKADTIRNAIEDGRLHADQRKKTTKRIKLADIPVDQRPRFIAPARTQFLNTIRIANYRAETALANVLRDHLSRPDDIRALLQDLFTHDADLIVDRNAKTLTVSVHHFTNPQASRAIAALLEKLNQSVEILGVTEHSNADYMTQVARNAIMDDSGWLKQVACRYMIHDRDTKFCGRWKEVLNVAGIETVAIPPRSPNLNSSAERYVRTIKSECVRRLWFIDYHGLCDVLHEYVRIHYNLERPHQGKGNRPLPAFEQNRVPPHKPIAGFKASQIRCVSRRGRRGWSGRRG